MTISTDVRPSSELHAVATAHHLTIDEMERLAVNAVMASFAPMDTCRALVTGTIHPAYH
jgi:hypothetical protein